jgi:hypothetical protein
MNVLSWKRLFVSADMKSVTRFSFRCCVALTISGCGRFPQTYDLMQCDSSLSEQLPEGGQVGVKHVAIDVILMLF